MIDVNAGEVVQQVLSQWLAKDSFAYWSTANDHWQCSWIITLPLGRKFIFSDRDMQHTANLAHCHPVDAVLDDFVF